MSLAPYHLAGERLLLDPAGLLSWPARGLLVASDLHLEKGSHFARRGSLVPPYDTRETIARLVSGIRRHAPRRLLLLGDSFHDLHGSVRMLPADRGLLRHALDGLDVVWVSGNHDPAPPDDLPGESCDTYRYGPLTFRHAAGAGEMAEISGHFHPKATMPTRAGGICRPCFVADHQRLILPAFGAFTGGLDARDPAIASLFPRGGRYFLLGRERLYAMPMPPGRRVTNAGRPLISLP